MEVHWWSTSPVEVSGGPAGSGLVCFSAAPTQETVVGGGQATGTQATPSSCRLRLALFPCGLLVLVTTTTPEQTVNT